MNFITVILACFCLLHFVSCFCGDGQPLECSIPWFVDFIDESLTPASKLFEPACIFHDYCYRHGPCTFSETKQSCDDQFYGNMEQICYNEKAGTDLILCLATARLFYSGVQAFGDPYWVPQDCNFCQYKNIVLRNTISSNESLNKLEAIFDSNLYSQYYFQNSSLNSSLLFQQYIQNGVAEGKIPSLLFDPQFYLQRYYDLAIIFNSNEYENATVHFIEQGQREGRQGSFLFDPQWYILTYNLSSQYNSSNYESVYTDYLENGLATGKAGTELFDPIYYLQRYTDVSLLSRNSTNPYHEAAIHFVVHGLEEGRVGSALFSAPDYLASREDLRYSLGNNSYYLAVIHYFSQERRIPSF